MHSQNLINIIADELPDLNKSESKVARVILADLIAPPPSMLRWPRQQMSVSQVLIASVNVLMPPVSPTLNLNWPSHWSVVCASSIAM